jgi:hypothetical protein
MVKSSFMPVQELSQETNYAPKSIYNQHSRGRGALAPILVKVGGKLGAWRADYDIWVKLQRRMNSEPPSSSILSPDQTA